ncbi:MAG: fibrobacter succinogenes major paralogous domain-containing protein [Dysgonamonadaceae bacterium]|jgi:uncharacterized protein (TIGR02145 family)|nr:fibrobacter succinogenes major paralogous domain-containing protein [Dysgonamonadaceae bacterium]
MKQKKIFLALALLVWSTAIVQAQVLIGGDATDNPSKGALLDLRNTDAIKGGLLLPRVALTDMNSLVDISGADKDPATLIGLTVYNTTIDAEGIYTWIGYKWDCMLPVVRDCSFAIDAEGHIYRAAEFGPAGCWMTQNLRSTGTYHGDVWQSLTEDRNEGFLNLPFYYYPSASKDTFDTYPEYGLLYTWAAANIGTDPAEGTDDVFSGIEFTRQGICPTGWHLPSHFEWDQLEEEIASSEAGVYSTIGPVAANTSTLWTWRGQHGPKMRSAVLIDDGTYIDGASNLYSENGFDSWQVGVMWRGDRYHYGRGAGYWTASDRSEGFAWCRYSEYGRAGVLSNAHNKQYGYSVRCKKN